MRKTALAIVGICFSLMLGSFPAWLFASESGGGYTVYDQVTPITGLVSGGGYSSVAAGDPISQTVSGSGYTLTGGIYNTEVVTSGTTGTGTSGTGTTGGGTTGGGGTGGSGGTAGGAGHGHLLVAAITFTGVAYPGGIVTLTEDGAAVANATAAPDGSFILGLTNLGAGNYIFGLSAVDVSGMHSILETFPVSLKLDTTTKISDIFIPPTATLDTSAVKQGGAVTIFGQTVPGATVTFLVQSASETVPMTLRTVADKKGLWLYKIDTTSLVPGAYSIQIRAATSFGLSGFSPTLSFTVVGLTIVLPPPSIKTSTLIGDLNGDGKIDLLDFSILTYWYGKTGFPPAVDLNHDGKIDMLDFSIMMYYWTS